MTSPSYRQSEAPCASKEFHSRTAGRFTKNIAWLLASEGVSRAVQFIAFGYLARVLGAMGLGILNWVQSVALMVAVLPNFGLNEYGILKISPDRSLSNISRVASDILSIRILLGSIAIIGMVLMTFWIPQYVKHQTLFLAGCTLQLTIVLAFDWFYTALENQSVVGIFRLLVRMGYMTATLSLVKTPDDILIALLLLIGSELILSASLFVYSFRLVHWRISFAGIARIRITLKEVWPLAIYVVNAGILYYVDLTIIAMILPMQAAGIYAGALRIISLFLSLKLIVGQMIYPKLASRVANRQPSIDLKEMISALNRYALMSGMTLLSILIMFSREIIVLALGPDFNSGWWVFALLSIALFAEFSWIAFPYLMISINSRAYVVMLAVVGIIKIVALYVILPAGGLLTAALVYGGSNVFLFILSIEYIRCRIEVTSSVKLVIFPLLFLIGTLAASYFIGAFADRLAACIALLGIVFLYLKYIGQRYSWSDIKADLIAISA